MVREWRDSEGVKLCVECSFRLELEFLDAELEEGRGKIREKFVSDLEDLESTHNNKKIEVYKEMLKEGYKI